MAIIIKKNAVCSYPWMSVSLFIHYKFQFLISGCISTSHNHRILCWLCLGTHLSQKQGFFVIKCDLAMIIENILLWKWYQMQYHYDGVPHYFTQIITHYLNQQFPNQGVICGSAQNWPLWWTDLNLLGNYVWGYVHAVVYACKMYMGELLWWFLNAARHIHNAAVVCKVTHSLVTWFRKCI